jgi:hypothetical protein
MQMVEKRRKTALGAVSDFPKLLSSDRRLVVSGASETGSENEG